MVSTEISMLLAFNLLVFASLAHQEVLSFRFPPSNRGWTTGSWQKSNNILQQPLARSPSDLSHDTAEHTSTALNSLPHQYQLENLESTLRHKIVSTDDTFNTTIFCNVELNCANLEAVGFDMDFTLAQVRDAMIYICLLSPTPPFLYCSTCLQY